MITKNDIKEVAFTEFTMCLNTCSKDIKRQMVIMENHLNV
jgi:hypothetical protein